jgi:hypothetical protein
MAAKSLDSAVADHAYMRTLMILFALCLFACRSGSSGSEFIGAWVKVGDSATKVDIKNDGDQYIVTLTDPSGHSQRYVGVLNQSAIKLNSTNLDDTISYTEKTDSLEWGGDLYMRSR